MRMSMQLALFFALNPDEALTVRDCAVKFGRDESSVLECVARMQRDELLSVEAAPRTRRAGRAPLLIKIGPALQRIVGGA